jgi:hypothetical protein
MRFVLNRNGRVPDDLVNDTIATVTSQQKFRLTKNGVGGTGQYRDYLACIDDVSSLRTKDCAWISVKPTGRTSGSSELCRSRSSSAIACIFYRFGESKVAEQLVCLGRIRSGVTTNQVPFRAAAGWGSSGWKVTRSRNGGTAADYASPSIIEQAIAGHDSIYWLTVTEDVTIGGGNTPTRINEIQTLTMRRSANDDLMEPVYGWIEIYVNDQSHTVGKALAIGGSPPISPIGFA